jgi:hypothetical protein
MIVRRLLSPKAPRQFSSDSWSAACTDFPMWFGLLFLLILGEGNLSLALAVALPSIAQASSTSNGEPGGEHQIFDN